LEVCGVGEDEAARLLAAANSSVKTAIVMHSLGVDAAEAERKISEAGGVVRRVISLAPPSVA
jgi:N-acetylmuramic acid 6-phosphate etherase